MASLSKLKELEDDTELFWTISKVFNGKESCKGLTVEQAIKFLNSILERTYSNRSLAIRAKALLKEIVDNSAVKKATTAKKDAVTKLNLTMNAE